MRFIEQHQHAGAPLQARALAAMVQTNLGVSVHPRSIERAVARKKNDKPPVCAGACDATLPADAPELYEDLRAAALCGQPGMDGMGAIVFHGMWRGLVVWITTRTAPTVRGQPAPSALPATVHDRQLVRLLANMVLAAESRVHHAY
ncbi:hypothetical protein [Pararobbsia alpina]|uniref:Uncharacterized protein n=1 Tax=Pararobbsia alpina TaxID=621374 RepID=A0A6S7BJW0_9BURK|nr:hypothetical protein [Pararobbsia alpina]CAB3802994.1 hypothetical protein LMG28138_05280 [Pararobbsia alpina]